MRVAVVDIGTNSTRLLLARLQDGQVIEEMARRSEVTRLGRGVDKDGSLSQEGMDRVFATLSEYRDIVDCDGGADVAVMSWVCRDRRNRHPLLQGVEELPRVPGGVAPTVHASTTGSQARI